MTELSPCIFLKDGKCLNPNRNRGIIGDEGCIYDFPEECKGGANSHDFDTVMTTGEVRAFEVRRFVEGGQ